MREGSYSVDNSKRCMRKSILGVVISLSVLTSCDLEKPVQTQSEKPRACSLKTAQQNQTGIRRIAPADLKVGSGYSTSVISNAQKFIIPVPAFVQGGEPLRSVALPFRSFEGRLEVLRPEQTPELE